MALSSLRGMRTFASYASAQLPTGSITNEYQRERERKEKEGEREREREKKEGRRRQPKRERKVGKKVVQCGWEGMRVGMPKDAKEACMRVFACVRACKAACYLACLLACRARDRLTVVAHPVCAARPHGASDEAAVPPHDLSKVAPHAKVVHRRLAPRAALSRTLVERISVHLVEPPIDHLFRWGHVSGILRRTHRDHAWAMDACVHERWQVSESRKDGVRNA